MLSFVQSRTCGETPCTCFSGSANSRVRGAQTDSISDEPANALHTTRKHMSECGAGPIFSFLFLIGAGEMCCNKGRTSVRSLLCNIEMSHVACGIIT